MIINTTNLKKFQRFLEKVTERGNQPWESVFLDTKAGKLHFLNSKTRGHLDLSIAFEPDEQPIPTFYVNTEKFFGLVREYDQLELRPDYNFYTPNDNGVFNLASIVDNDLFVASGSEIPPVFETSLLLNLQGSGMMSLIQEASQFASTDLDSPFCGVFVRTNSIIGSDRKIFYERKTVEAGDEELGVDLPLWIIDLIRQIPFSEVTLGVTSSNFVFDSIEDSFSVTVAKSVNLSPPPFDNPDFISTYSTSVGFSVNRETLVSQLKFFKPFVKEAPNTRIKLTVEASHLNLTVTDAALISRQFPIVVQDPILVGKEFWLNTDLLVRVLGVFSEGIVTIRTTDESSVINVMNEIDGVADENFHVVLTKVKV